MTRPSISLARIVSLPTSVDPRGALTAVEGGIDAPFEIKRLFYMWGIKEPFERGSHAHPDTEQLLICVSSSLNIDLSDGQSTQTYRLDDPTRGLYLPPMIWTYLYDFTPETVCLALASTHYEPGKVIRDWDQYCRMINRA